MLVLTQNAYAATQMRVNMSAHIIESSIANLKETEWTLYKSTSISGGDDSDNSNLISTKLQSFKGPIQSIVLPVGQYIIKAQYGEAVKVQGIKVERDDPKTFLNLKIVFNLGALKLSSNLGNKKQIISSGVTYVVRNVASGKIVLETSDISKTHYLMQGDYNVTAQLSDVTVTDAMIKIIANNLNDVIIRHKVGEIHLNFDNIESKIGSLEPKWVIVGAKNSVNKEVSIADSDIPVLLPAGDYKLMFEWGDFVYTREFGIHPGQIIEFSIPKQ